MPLSDSVGRSLRASAVALLLAAATAAGAAGVAAAGGEAAERAEAARKHSDLEDVKRRIRELEKEIADTEGARSGASDALREAERAVSRAQRRLRELAGERGEAERALALLEAERGEVEARITSRRAELAEWLRRHYVHGAGDNIAPLLSTRDPNQLARDAHYLEHLGRARLALLDSLRGDLREKAHLQESIGERRDRLVALETEQARERAALEAVQAERKRALAGLSEQLKNQQQQVQALRQDEERLGRVIEALARQAAERAAQRAAAERAAAERAAAERAARAAARRDPPAGGASATRSRSEAVVGEVRQASGPTPTGVSFAQLRGKMRFPVRGELVGRFGAPRAEGGTPWRGVFIRVNGGEEVRAVAAGEVVFSDWLRGYGNLIIVDHGDDYLSIYGNNDALLREVGDAIAGGDPIASVGASGEGPESGLYFEIRYRGQPVDPLQWVRLN